MRIAIAAALAAELLPTTAFAAPPTTAEADAFVQRAEQELLKDYLGINRVEWINETYITDDTDALAAEAGAASTELAVRLALEAAKFKDVAGLSFDTKRKLDALTSGIVLPAPTRPGAAQELSEISPALLQLRQGRGHARRQADRRQRHRGRDGHQPRSRRS